MRKLVFFMHISLDGFVAGLKGELNFIKVDEEIFDFVGTMTDNADAALYGRVTYEMMQSYWPSAGQQPGASKHDIEHSSWYNRVSKIVLSKSMSEDGLSNTTVLSTDLVERINEIKKQEGKNILIFGSPRASLALLELGLIDEFWFFVNPIIVGKGTPLFTHVIDTIKLDLVESKTFACGVIALHYRALNKLA